MKQLLLILTVFSAGLTKRLKFRVVTDNTKQPYQAHQF
jgi:hypothetical protein